LSPKAEVKSMRGESRGVSKIEGFGRQASGEYRHHLCIARGSLLELETQTILCQRLDFLSNDLTTPILTEIAELSKMMATLIGKLR
jgi:four helix bundle protein